jgi:isopentenyl-diphosphate delta-isomerase
MKNIHSHRKDEHISLAEKFYCEQATAGFEKLQLQPNSLPELSIDDVDLSTTLAGIPMPYPFFIQAMTGGSEYTAKLNARLAKIAKQTGLAMAVGSQSVAIKYPELAESFKIVRDTNPDGLILANVGATADLAKAQRAVEMIGANALQLHINVAQEVVMPEGDRSFNYLEQIETVVKGIDVPVIVKSVGNGMTADDAAKLKAVGVLFVDVGGKGGTNFIQIENARRHAKDFDFMRDFGLTTVDSLKNLAGTELSVTATGGIRNASDIIKSLVLGADNVGIAGYFLHELLHHDDQYMIDLIESMKYQLKALMVLVGARTVADLRNSPHIKISV